MHGLERTTFQTLFAQSLSVYLQWHRVEKVIERLGEHTVRVLGFG